MKQLYSKKILHYEVTIRGEDLPMQIGEAAGNRLTDYLTGTTQVSNHVKLNDMHGSTIVVRTHLIDKITPIYKRLTIQETLELQTKREKKQ